MRADTSFFSGIAVPTCSRGSSDLRQTKLDLVAVLVDRLHLDQNVVAEAELAARGVAAQAVLALAEHPKVAADRRHRHHPLHEDLVELDEEPERRDAGDDPAEALPDFVAHEDDLLPL